MDAALHDNLSTEVISLLDIHLVAEVLYHSHKLYQL